ncbi:hypothetical protein Q9Q94_10320 [Uliginosibacterium sp. 31-16]|uniref:hypothetical protein n=1 Tax=Uliginosibacterium sp. 31-16 TaxID=3068315 RepID=UPI00273F16A1|nr:hypothetical protein [Uliginosibacterium sp. 31-16]MDP5239930.1 hypothetical protein [Uliginosibacterium sp. 31-16]
MAGQLFIPETRSALPQQTAGRITDPSGQFGNAVAPALGPIRVPQGYGGVVADTAVAGRAAAQALDQASNIGFAAADQSMRVDQYKAETLRRMQEDTKAKEEALNFGVNDSMLKQAQINYTAKLSGLRADISKRLNDGSLSVEDAKTEFDKGREQIIDDEGFYKHTDARVQTAANLWIKGRDYTDNEDLAKHVLIPHQTDQAKAGVTGIASSAVSSTTQISATGTDPQEIFKNWMSNNKAIFDAFSTPQAAVALSQEDRVKGLQKATTDNAVAVVSGIIARQAPRAKGESDEAYYQKQLKQDAANAGLLKEFLQVPGFQQALGPKLDEMQQRVDAVEKRAYEQLRNYEDLQLRKADLMQRKAEAAQKRSDAQLLAHASFDIHMNGADSKFVSDPTWQKRLTSPEAMMHAQTLTFDAVQRDIGNVRDAKEVQGNIALGQSYANASGEDKKKLDTLFNYQERDPNFKALTPEQQAGVRAQWYVQAGTIPPTKASDLNRALGSADPNIKARAIAQLQAIEQTDKKSDPRGVSPLITSALSPENQAYYFGVTRQGKDFATLDKERASRAQATSEQLKIADDRFKDAYSKDPVKVREKASTALSKLARTESGDGILGFGGLRAVPDFMADAFASSVKNNMAAGMDKDTAEHAAFADLKNSKGFGKSKLTNGGTEAWTFAAPSKVFGVDEPFVQQGLDHDLKGQSFITRSGKSVALRSENVQLVPTQATMQNKKYELWVKDPDTNLYSRLRQDPANPLSPTANWTFAPTPDQVKAAVDAEAKRLSSAGKQQARTAAAALAEETQQRNLDELRQAMHGQRKKSDTFMGGQ